MKILSICVYTWEYGGPPKVVHDHTVEQMKAGHEVTILTPYTKGQKIYTLPEGANIVICRRNWLSKLWSDFSIDLAKWLLKNGNNFDIIHIHGLWSFGSVIPFLLNIRTPKCITIHGYLDNWALKSGYWKKRIFSFVYQKPIFRKTQLIQVFNDREYNDLIKYLGYVHENIIILPNGIDIENFKKQARTFKFRESMNIDRDSKLILFLSRINVKKGLDLLLPAFNEISKTHSNYVLVLVGSDDGYMQDVKKFIENNNLYNIIKLSGMLIGKQKLEAFADADIFILPSYSEGFSIATLEALLLGIPSVISINTGFSKEIQDANAAKVVELNIESIKNGVLEVGENKEFANLLAKNGENLIKTKYDIKVISSSLMESFKKIM